MASISRLSRDKRKKNAPYYIRFVDHQGKRRTTKGCSDRGVTQSMAARIETMVQQIRLGTADVAELDALLGKPQQDDLELLLSQFEKSLKTKGNTEKHVKLTMSRIRLVIDGCRYRSLGNINADTVEAFVADYCEKEDCGHRTYNHYLQSIESFGNWLVHPSRRLCEHNPFAGIPRRNAATDVRHKRRALTAQEIALLIDTARNSNKTVQCYSGETRARIYLLAYMTGLRKGEIASLTPRSLDLDAPQPKLTVSASASKHRREDTLPLHADLVSLVRKWVEGVEDDQPLFPKLAHRKAYFMIRRDLEDAGIPYETEDGVADFHAAGRHSHITELLRSGVKLTEARELARHSDVRMTMRYTHVRLEDQAQAVNKLPSPQLPATEPGDECLHIVSTESGADGQTGAVADSGRQQDEAKEKRRNPSRERSSASSDSRRHESAPTGKKWRRRESNPRAEIA